MLKIDEAEAELGVGIGRNQGKLGGEFRGSVGPVFPEDIGLSCEVMSFGQLWVDVQGAMQGGNGAGIVSNFNPEPANKKQRYRSELAFLVHGEHFACRLQVARVRERSCPGIADGGVLRTGRAERRKSPDRI